jgi:hypothetical protein
MKKCRNWNGIAG